MSGKNARCRVRCPRCSDATPAPVPLVRRSGFWETVVRRRDTSPRNARGATLGRAFLNFSLYFQNSKLAGANRKRIQIYICPIFRYLPRSVSFYPLDKFSVRTQSPAAESTSDAPQFSGPLFLPRSVAWAVPPTPFAASMISGSGTATGGIAADSRRASLA